MTGLLILFLTTVCCNVQYKTKVHFLSMRSFLPESISSILMAYNYVNAESSVLKYI